MAPNACGIFLLEAVGSTRMIILPSITAGVFVTPRPGWQIEGLLCHQHVIGGCAGPLDDNLVQGRLDRHRGREHVAGPCQSHVSMALAEDPSVFRISFPDASPT